MELLVSQVKRCDDILKKLTLNPNVEDDFIEKDLSLSSYINQIAKSYEQISSKKFLINLEQDTNPFPINKSIELVYGIRNFIGNANKFSTKYIYSIMIFMHFSQSFKSTKPFIILGGSGIVDFNLGKRE